MIDYGLFTFASVPLSGEEWFIKTAQLAGLGIGFCSHAIVPFEPDQPANKMRVSLVRHPWDWLFLAYQQHKLGKLNGYVGRINLLKGSTFDEFVYSYLEKCPGAITQLWKSCPSDSCMRIEDQPQAFVELLSMLEVPDVFMGLVRGQHRPMSVAVEPLKNPGLRSAVIESEKEICDAFDYF